MAPSANIIARITARQATIGSPVYMSPEQMESARDVDARTDVWSLGVTLCELLTGQLPYEGTTLVHMYARIAANAPLRLQEKNPHLPADIEAVILRCLQRNPERRYCNVTELAMALMAFGSSDAANHVERTLRARHPVAALSTTEEKGALSPTSHLLENPPVDTTLRSPAPVPGSRAPSSASGRGVARPMALSIAFVALAIFTLWRVSTRAVREPVASVGSFRVPASLPAFAPPRPEPSLSSTSASRHEVTVGVGSATAAAALASDAAARIAQPIARVAAPRDVTAVATPTSVAPAFHPLSPPAPSAAFEAPGSPGVAEASDALGTPVDGAQASAEPPPPPAASDAVYVPPRIRK